MNKDAAMTSSLRLLAAAALATTLAAPVTQAAEFSTPQRSEIEAIVREYLIAHPEVLQEAMVELEKRQSAADAEKHKAAVSENAKTLFTSPNQVVLGNPQGN
ncbi:MAG: DsbA family protein, partial [Pseudolabrys sp.]|nr:DsbA family protein [Pseudolabrys sp.]